MATCGLRLSWLTELSGGRWDALHSATPHPDPLPCGRGEGEASPDWNVAHAGDYSVTTYLRRSSDITLESAATPGQQRSIWCKAWFGCRLA